MYSCVKPYEARSLKWPLEQDQRKNSYGRCTRPYGQEIVLVLKIVRGPFMDVTETLMTSWYEHDFRITGPLSGNWCIPLTKG